MKLIALLTFLTSLIIACHGANILILSPFVFEGQQIIFDAMATDLSERGHNVTYLAAYEPSKEAPGIKTLLVHPKTVDQINYVSSELFKINLIHQVLFNVGRVGLHEWFYDANLPFYSSYVGMTGLRDFGVFNLNSLLMAFFHTSHLYRDACHHVLRDPTVRQLRITPDKEFDVVIVSSMIHQCWLPLAKCIIDAPIILMSPTQLDPNLAWKLKIPQPMSYVPMPMTSFSEKISFFQRMRNVLFTKMWELLNSGIDSRVEKEVTRHICNTPTSAEIERDVSLVLLNTHFSVDGAKSLMPNVKEVGCIHCRKGQPLPPAYEEFLEDADEGFIVFSLGSGVKTSFLPQLFIQTLLKTFYNLGQKVILKHDGPFIEMVPTNVLIDGWIPQQDLLAHKNCRLLITGGGLMATQEALYHGVPVLGIPVQFDSKQNIENLKNMNCSLSLDGWATFKEPELQLKIEKLLNDGSYKQHATKMSERFKDREQEPLKTASYWVEYVIRHRGAPQLSSELAKNLNDFQYFAHDIILGLLTCVLFLFIIVCCLCQGIGFLYNRIGNRNGNMNGNRDGNRNGA